MPSAVHRINYRLPVSVGLRFPYGARGFWFPMTVTTGVLGRRRVQAASLSGHPEVAPAAAVLAAWVLLLVFAARAVGGATSAAMPGMPMPAASGSPWSAAAANLPSWLLMTVAMMGPALVGNCRDVSRAGTATLRALATFGVGYLAVWAVFGLLAEAAVTAIRGVPSPQALALCLAVATAWQLMPVKDRVLRACRAGGPATGAQCATRQPADSGTSVRSGLRFGLCCLGTCWCLMLVPLVAPGGQLPWMAGLTILISAERLVPVGPRPATRALTHAVAGALAVTTVATLAIAGLLQ